MLGVVGNKEIWATKIQYLNDDNEYKLAFKIAKEYFERLLLRGNEESMRIRIEKCIASLSNVENVHICICSLSENGDLLSQWRGYSKSLGGYSIGFNKEELENYLNDNGFDLKKCIYSTEDQRNIIHKEIDSVLLKFDDTAGPNPHYTPTDPYGSQEMCLRLSRISPIIKDPSFSEEREWRIISRGGISLFKLDYRQGPSMLIPYFKIKLNEAKNKLIQEIIVGHTPHLQLAKSSTEAFVIKHYPNSHRPHVRTSAIPFRNW